MVEENEKNSTMIANSEQRTANSEQRTANSEQRTANSEQRTANSLETNEESRAVPLADGAQEADNVKDATKESFTTAEGVPWEDFVDGLISDANEARSTKESVQDNPSKDVAAQPGASEKANDAKESATKQDANANKKKNQKFKKDPGDKLLLFQVISAFAILGFFLAIGYSMSLQSKVDNLKEETSELRVEVSDLEAKNSELEDEIYEMENSASRQLVDVKNAFEKKQWSLVISLAKTLHEEHNGSAEDKQAQELAKQAQAKIDAEKKAAAEREAAEKQAAAQREAQAYETGITYNQLARTPDPYEGKKVKFYGRVVQVLESGGDVAIRLAVNGDYNAMLYCEYDSSIVSSRVLEDDYITIYGTSAGLYSYESTLGATITIPGIWVSKIAR